MAVLACVLLGIGGIARADEPPGLSAREIDEDCGQLGEPSAPVTAAPVTAAPVTGHTVAVTPVPTASQDVAISGGIALPRGRSIGQLSASQCRGLLEQLGVDAEDASGEGGPVDAVQQPIRLRGPIGDLIVRPHGGDPRSIHSILDCRLAVALYAWSPMLRAAGFIGIEHVSVFRPGARVASSGHPSGHSHALAIDALRFVRADGTTFSVLDDWTARTRGADPCGTYDEGAEAHALREAICAGAAAELFEVIVTPHHDDAHANHVHLEVVPGVDWTAMR